MASTVVFFTIALLALSNTASSLRSRISFLVFMPKGKRSLSSWCALQATQKQDRTAEAESGRGGRWEHIQVAETSLTIKWIKKRPGIETGKWWKCCQNILGFGLIVLSLPYHPGPTWTRSQAKQVQARVDRLRQAEARGGGGGGQRWLHFRLSLKSSWKKSLISSKSQVLLWNKWKPGTEMQTW